MIHFQKRYSCQRVSRYYTKAQFFIRVFDDNLSIFQIKIHITTYFVLLFLIKTKVYGIYKIEVNCSGWINNFLFVVIDTHAAGLAPVCSCTALCFRRFSQMRGKIPTTGSQSHAFRINVKDLTVFAILPFGSAFQDETWYCTIWVHIKTFSLHF